MENQTPTKVVNVKVAYIRPLGYQNLKEWMEDENNVYIGRKGIVFVKDGDNKYRFPKRDSIFKNPFKIGKNGNDDRESVIRKYKEYLGKMIEEGTITREDLQKLKGKNLGCWCRPSKECHGDVLKEYVDALTEK